MAWVRKEVCGETFCASETRLAVVHDVEHAGTNYAVLM